PLAEPPLAATLALKVLPDARSRTKTSDTRLVSFGTRLLAVESKATNRPCPSMVGYALSRFAWSPAVDTLTRSVRPDAELWTKTSAFLLVSPWTRFVATESNAVNRPFALIACQLNRLSARTAGSPRST